MDHVIAARQIKHMPTGGSELIYPGPAMDQGTGDLAGYYFFMLQIGSKQQSLIAEHACALESTDGLVVVHPRMI